MSKLHEEIRRCMTEPSKTAEGKIVSRFLFPMDFLGFQGHFPENPVLPGMCEVAAVITMMETWHKEPIRIEKIVLAKFVAAVSHNENLRIECEEILGESGYFLVKAKITRENKEVATLHLELKRDSQPSEGNTVAS